MSMLISDALEEFQRTDPKPLPFLGADALFAWQQRRDDWLDEHELRQALTEEISAALDRVEALAESFRGEDAARHAKRHADTQTLARVRATGQRIASELQPLMPPGTVLVWDERPLIRS